MAITKQRISLKDVAISIGNTIVGGAEELSITITAEDTIAHEGGSYLPAEVVDGAITINGAITRAFIDVDLLNDIFPDSGIKPSYTLTGEVISGKTPGRTIAIIGAKFGSIDINGLALTDYAKNALNFNAVAWKFV